MPKIPAGQKAAPRGAPAPAPGKTKKKPKPGRRGAAPASLGAKTRSKGRERVSTKALTQFTTQLSTLQDAGLPIVRSLKILEGQMDRGPFKLVLAANQIAIGNRTTKSLCTVLNEIKPLTEFTKVKRGSGNIYDQVLFLILRKSIEPVDIPDILAYC